MLLWSIDIFEMHFWSFYWVSNWLRESCSLELLYCKIVFIVNNLELVSVVILFRRIIDNDIFFFGRICEVVACEYAFFEVIWIHNSNLNWNYINHDHPNNDFIEISKQAFITVKYLFYFNLTRNLDGE